MKGLSVRLMPRWLAKMPTGRLTLSVGEITERNFRYAKFYNCLHDAVIRVSYVDPISQCNIKSLAHLRPV